MKRVFLFFLTSLCFIPSYSMFRNLKEQYSELNPYKKNFIIGLLVGTGIDITILDNMEMNKKNKYLNSIMIGIGGLTLSNIPSHIINKSQENTDASLADWIQRNSESLSLVGCYIIGYFTGIALGDVIKKNIISSWKSITGQHLTQIIPQYDVYAELSPNSGV